MIENWTVNENLLEKYQDKLQNFPALELFFLY